MQAHKKEPTPLVLVLASGGTRGLAHVGVLEVLYEAGLIPNFIAGSSAGAIMGSLFADRQDPTHVKEIALTMARYPYNYHLFGPPYLLQGARGYGFFGTKGFQVFLHKQLQATTFEELAIPLAVAATDVEEGTVTYFEKGPLVPAVAASACIPGMFEPVQIGGRYYVDGHVLDPLPVAFAQARWGAQVTVAVNIANHVKEGTSLEGSNILGRCFEIAYKERLVVSLALADVVIDLDFEKTPSSLWVRKATVETLYTQGKEAAFKALPAIRSALERKG